MKSLEIHLKESSIVVLTYLTGSMNVCSALGTALLLLLVSCGTSACKIQSCLNLPVGAIENPLPVHINIEFTRRNDDHPIIIAC